jgi:hypothetical protein
LATVVVGPWEVEGATVVVVVMVGVEVFTARRAWGAR